MELKYDRPVTVEAHSLRVIVERNRRDQYGDILYDPHVYDFTVELDTGKVTGDFPVGCVGALWNRASIVVLDDKGRVIISGRECGARLECFDNFFDEPEDGKIVEWDFCPRSKRELQLILGAIAHGEHEELDFRVLGFSNKIAS